MMTAHIQQERIFICLFNFNKRIAPLILIIVNLLLLMTFKAVNIYQKPFQICRNQGHSNLPIDPIRRNLISTSRSQIALHVSFYTSIKAAIVEQSRA